MSQEEMPVTPLGPISAAGAKKPVSMRRAFLTGLAALLPLAVTIGLLVWVFRLVGDAIAEPINDTTIQVIAWIRGMSWGEAEGGFKGAEFGSFVVDFSFTGYIIAVLLIFAAGFALLTFLGRRLYRVLDRLLSRLPIMRMIYPHVKQLTDFIFSENKATAFRHVVMVEYPRKGLWSLGFVTGAAMTVVQEKTTADVISVFIPSSPTPFTGYVVAVPRDEVVDLPISVDEALRFTISGGVLVPPGQRPELPGPESGEEGTAPGGSTEH